MCNRFPGVYCRGSRNFSSCSAEDFEKLTLNKGGSCLLNVPKPDEAYSAPSCGNKLVDPGEECDCGTPQVSWPSAWLCEVTLGFGTSGGGVAMGFCGEVRIAMVLCGCVSGTGQHLDLPYEAMASGKHCDTILVKCHRSVFYFYCSYWIVTGITYLVSSLSVRHAGHAIQEAFVQLDPFIK